MVVELLVGGLMIKVFIRLMTALKSVEKMIAM